MFPIPLGVVLVTAALADDRLDSPMYADPPVAVARVAPVYPPGSLDLWLTAFDRPEQDFRAQAATTIASARQRGMPGLGVAVGPLIRELDRSGGSAAVRLAAARALVTLDAKDAAPALLRHLADGADYREVVEPALARWGFEPARAVWLERLGQPPPFNRGTVLAMRGLATARDERALPLLRGVALSPDPPAAYRVEAAKAWGLIRPAGQEADAERLAGGPVPARLAAAWLLRQSREPAAVRLLQKLAADAEPAAAAVAVVRLVELDPKHVLPVLGPVLASPEQAVRAAGVEVLFRLPGPEHITLLGDRLNDPHPDVRATARRALRQLAATPALRGRVIEQGTLVLGGNDWRGQEQAAILLARLGHKPAAKRMVELLDAADRGEAFAGAAFGLRVLAVPETLPAVLDHVRRRHQAMLKLASPNAGIKGVSAELVDRELCQLAQFLGRARYAPADDALRALVPRFRPVQPEARAAALWALGMIHEGKPEEGLAALVEDRLTGDPGRGNDDPRVRRMAALALARMKATGSLEVLRAFSLGPDPTPDIVPNACRVAAALLAGEPIPAAGVFEVIQRDPFLAPVK